MDGPELYYRTLIMPHDAFGENELAGRPKFIGNDDIDVLDWASDLIVWATRISIIRRRTTPIQPTLQMFTL